MLKPVRSTVEYWGLISSALHWLMALGITGMLVLGLLMVEYPMSALKLKLFIWHKSTGLALLTLALLRLAWRVAEVRPGWPAQISPAHQRVARAAHGLLYVLMVLIPVSGFLVNMTAGYPLNWFGVVSIPVLMEPDERLQALATDVHRSAVWVLMVVLGAHVLGALDQQFRRGTALIRRIWIW